MLPGSEIASNTSSSGRERLEPPMGRETDLCGYAASQVYLPNRRPRRLFFVPLHVCGMI
jgi:hypothetical protein